MRIQSLISIIHLIVMATKSYFFYVSRHDCRLVMDKLKYIYTDYWPEIYGDSDDKPLKYVQDRLQYLEARLYMVDDKVCPTDSRHIVIGLLQFRQRKNIQKAKEFFNGALGIYKINLFNIRRPLARQ